jgi:SAM-dependent methyltransferase
MSSPDTYRWVAQLCPMCEVPPARRLGRRGGLAHRGGLGVTCEIWRCGGCGLIFPDPMPVPVRGPEQHYGMPADDYFAHHDPAAKARTGAGLLEQAALLTGSKGRVLDIGAGRGELLREARSQGWSSIGIETSPSFADQAARHSGVEVRRESIEHCGFAAGSFDAVILSAVLEHVYDPNGLIREIARVLRPGGALFIQVPNEQGLYFRLGNLYQKLRGRDWVVNLSPTFAPFHIFGFSPRSLRRLLAKHGLRPTAWRTYGGQALLPRVPGAMGALEWLGARVVTLVGKVGPLGEQIETWAIKAADAPGEP